MKILVTPRSFKNSVNDEAREKLEQFAEVKAVKPEKPFTEDELIALLDGCDGYVAGLDNVTAKVIENCPQLKVISRWGVGYDKVDTAAASKAGITVTYTPGVMAVSVAELALGLMLDCARRITVQDGQVRGGAWAPINGMELFGKTVGIIGYGAIGKQLGRLTNGIGMTTYAYDPFMNEAYAKEHNVLARVVFGYLRAHLLNALAYLFLAYQYACYVFFHFVYHCCITPSLARFGSVLFLYEFYFNSVFAVNVQLYALRRAKPRREQHIPAGSYQRKVPLLPRQLCVYIRILQLFAAGSVYSMEPVPRSPLPYERIRGQLVRIYAGGVSVARPVRHGAFCNAVCSRLGIRFAVQAERLLPFARLLYVMPKAYQFIACPYVRARYFYPCACAG